MYNVHLLCRFAELEKYTELDFKPTSKKNCDIIEKKPTVLIKLDAGDYTDVCMHCTVKPLSSGVLSMLIYSYHIKVC